MRIIYLLFIFTFALSCKKKVNCDSFTLCSGGKLDATEECGGVDNYRYLDLDKDGTDDIEFYARNYSSGQLNTMSLQLTGLDGTEIQYNWVVDSTKATYTDPDSMMYESIKMVHPLWEGELINNTTDYTSDPVYISEWDQAGSVPFVYYNHTELSGNSFFVGGRKGDKYFWLRLTVESPTRMTFVRSKYETGEIEAGN